MRVYLIRHADPDYAKNTITAAGHKEAEALSRRLLKEGIDKIYCSPMGRAIDTAGYTAEKLKLDLNIEHWTREMWPELALGESSPWGNIFAVDVPGEVYREKEYLRNILAWQEYDHIKNVQIKEGVQTMINNSDEFFIRHGYKREGGRYRIEKRNDLKIALFCHCAFGLTWLSHLLEIPTPLIWTGFWLPPSSVTTILFEERSSDWAIPRLINLGDTSHLYESNLPISPRGIKGNFY